MSKPATASAEHGAGAKSGGMSGKLKIGGIILAVVLLEWVAAYCFLGGTPAPAHDGEETEGEANPGGDEPAAHGEEHASGGHAAAKPSEHGGEHGGGHGGGHGKEAPKEGVHHGDQEEVDLGEFTVTAYQPVSNSTLFISFHLYGTCMHKHAEEFEQRLADTKFRIRDNVIVIIRSAEISDLTDAGLGLIKRRILETTNKALGKSLLQSVIFSDFSFIEQ